MEKFWFWFTWKLPRRLIYFAVIRLFAEATTGRYSSRTPTEVNVFEALEAWKTS